MAAKKVRFTVGIAVVIAALGFLAVSGYQEGKAYYTTLEEFDALPASSQQERLRVAGFVREGTIVRDGTEVTFELGQDGHSLKVHYTGSGPVPDTFKDGVDAVVEGYRRPDGVFEADHIQAKCASKYEAEYESAESSDY